MGSSPSRWATCDGCGEDITNEDEHEVRWHAEDAPYLVYHVRCFPKESTCSPITLSSTRKPSKT